METVFKIKRRSKREKLHNPAMLAVKKAARALGVTWADITAERDRLRAADIETREWSEDARKAAWAYWLHRSGRAKSGEAFWRNGFQRAFAKRLAQGGDYTKIRFYDEIARAAVSAAPELTEWSLDEIWEMLLADYKPRADVGDLYETALANVLLGRQRVTETYDQSTPF